MISSINKGLDTRIDQDVADAVFLRRNSGWKPEDLGYPAGDYILIDLMRMLHDA